MSCRIACLLGPLAISARPANAQVPAPFAVAYDSELVADRHRWSMLRTAPDSVQRSTSDPYPALFTQRRMAAAEACGVGGYVWRMPDMLRVIFVEKASMEAKREAAALVGGRFLLQTGDDTFVLWLYPTRDCKAGPAAVQLRSLPVVALVSTLDLAAMKE